MLKLRVPQRHRVFAECFFNSKPVHLLERREQSLKLVEVTVRLQVTRPKTEIILQIP